MVDDLTPEFCLKMGHKFVASSKSEASGGVSAELRKIGYPYPVVCAAFMTFYAREYYFSVDPHFKNYFFLAPLRNTDCLVRRNFCIIYKMN